MLLLLECKNHEDMDVDLDRNFLLSLRELKVLVEKEYLEEHRGVMLRTAKGFPDRVKAHLNDNFRVSVWKNTAVSCSALPRGFLTGSKHTPMTTSG